MPGWVAWLVIVFGLANVFEIVLNLWPRRFEFNAILLNNIAWADLLSWNQDVLGRACDFSQQAIEALPWESYVKGTRGSALVASGEVERGMILLRQALADNEDLHNKAF